MRPKSSSLALGSRHTLTGQEDILFMKTVADLWVSAGRPRSTLAADNVVEIHGFARLNGPPIHTTPPLGSSCKAQLSTYGISWIGAEVIIADGATSKN